MIDQRSSGAGLNCQFIGLRISKWSPSIQLLQCMAGLVYHERDCIEKERCSQSTGRNSQTPLATIPILECHKTIIAGFTQA